MPFVSNAQRRFMYAKHPELAKEFEAATPKGKKLPERKKTSALTDAYNAGIVAALTRFKFAGEEVRLKIPRRQYHGWDEAWREARRRGEGLKKADDGATPLEPQGHPHAPVERLTAMLQKIDTPLGGLAAEATKDPLDRTTMWGGATNPEGGDAGTREPSLNLGMGSPGIAF